MEWIFLALPFGVFMFCVGYDWGVTTEMRRETTRQRAEHERWKARNLSFQVNCQQPIEDVLEPRHTNNNAINR